MTCWSFLARFFLDNRNHDLYSTLAYIYKEGGMKALYRGVTPRIGLGIWQTVCMVSFAE